jgi:hypothetical protein
MARRPELERQVASVLLAVFASLLLGLTLLEVILTTNAPRATVWSDFIEKSNIGFVMPYFLAYLVIGAAGLAGTLGLVGVYGQGVGLAAELVRFSALAYFTLSYWLWSAMWIVQHKLTLLAEVPTSPPPQVLEMYDAFDALWALPAWGALGPEVGLFIGLAWLLSRGVRLLPRAAAALFAFLALSRLAGLVFIGISSPSVANVAEPGFAFYNDLAFTIGRILAFLLAAAALLTEKGIFGRTRR